jgi:hypothetical protein
MRVADVQSRSLDSTEVTPCLSGVSIQTAQHWRRFVCRTESVDYASQPAVRRAARPGPRKTISRQIPRSPPFPVRAHDPGPLAKVSRVEVPRAKVDRGFQTRCSFPPAKRQWLAGLQSHHRPLDAPVYPLKSLLNEQILQDPLCLQSSLQPGHNEWVTLRAEAAVDPRLSAAQ